MKVPTILPIRIVPKAAPKINKHIEIVGTTTSRLSSMSASSRLSILEALRENYIKVDITIVNNLHDLELLAAKKPDLVILGVKLILLDTSKSYDTSPKLWLSAYLDEKKIAYTGSDAIAFAFEFDKQKAKQQILAAGMQSSAFFISAAANPTFSHKLRFPLFVKPANLGDSKGVDEQSVVYTNDFLQAKIVAIHDEWGSDALIEEYLPGREFSVAVIRQRQSNDLLAMPIEIVTPPDAYGHSFLSAAIKQNDTEQVLRVADIALKQLLTTFAVNAFLALGARDYGRIDIRLDADGMPNFIEANLMPGLSNHGYLARCFAMNENISYKDMILSITALALARDQRITPLDTVAMSSVLNLEQALRPV